MKTAVGDSGKDKRRARSAREIAPAPIAQGQDGYFALASRPGGCAVTPILRTASGVGERLLSAVDRATATVSSLPPLLPSSACGVHVQETLYRFDANAHLPTRERGISSANRVGEPLALLSMQVRPVPDDFDGRDRRRSRLTVKSLM